MKVGLHAYTHWRERFEQVLDERYYTIEWLDHRVAGQTAFVWATDKAAIIAELRSYPTGAKDVHGLLAAGELDEIRDVLIPAAETFGRQMRCVAAVIESTPGWKRVLAGSGYMAYQLAVRKDL